MLIDERRSRLSQMIAQRGMCHLEDLAAELGVSPSTVRRDVEHLARQGKVKRTHGGVIWIADRSSAVRPYAFDQRLTFQTEAKRRIARAAGALVGPGQTILLDGGTTTFHLAQELLGRPLQIVTNSLPIANLYMNDENVELILSGGLMYPRYGVLLGPAAEQMLASIHAQSMFFSVAGIHDGALYNQNMLLVTAEQRMMKQAQQRILLADSSKFGQQALVRLCGLNEIDTVVTDSALSEEMREHIRAAGVRLMVAE